MRGPGSPVLIYAKLAIIGASNTIRDRHKDIQKRRRQRQTDTRIYKRDGHRDRHKDIQTRRGRDRRQIQERDTGTKKKTPKNRPDKRDKTNKKDKTNKRDGTNKRNI